MIILGNNKDYYDYLSNVYGVDNKKVFDRRNIVTSKNYSFEDIPRFLDRNIFNFYIGTRHYIMEQVSKDNWEPHLFHKVNTNFEGKRSHLLKSKIENKDLKFYVNYLATDFNNKIGYPISIKRYRSREQHEYSIPILESFNFSSIVTPQEIYSELDMFLGWLIDNPCKIKEATNDIKIQSNGFDSKISFRHRK